MQEGRFILFPRDGCEPIEYSARVQGPAGEAKILL